MSFHAGDHQFRMAGVILTYCQAMGVKHVCIAPGSRSAPLTLAAAACPTLQKTVFYDERALGFFALGVAKKTQRPVVIITTSGSAVANLVPACVEAFYARVPLLFLTADRPAALHHKQANQTIEQMSLLKAITCFQQDCESSLATLDERVLAEQMKDAQVWLQKTQQPIHLNCPFVEPLAPQSLRFPDVDLVDTNISKTPETAENIKVPAEITPTHPTKGVVLVGSLYANHPELSNALNALQWPVLADVLSPLDIRNISETYCPETWEGQTLKECDILLQIGTRLTSKRMQQLGEHAKKHIVFSEFEGEDNPFGTVTAQYIGRITERVHAIAQHQVTPSPLWKTHVAQSAQKSIDALSQVLEQGDEPELQAIYDILQRLPIGATLMVSNSMPIRWVNYAVSLCTQKQLNVFGNRGASGIDGIVATACGLATGGSTPPVHVIIGDMACAYDVNSLGLLRNTTVTVWVIQNQGGQIFRRLPDYKTLTQETYQTYFAVDPKLELEKIAAGYGVSYTKVTSRHMPEEIQTGPHIIEVVPRLKTNSTV